MTHKHTVSHCLYPWLCKCGNDARTHCVICHKQCYHKPEFRSRYRDTCGPECYAILFKMYMDPKVRAKARSEKMRRLQVARLEAMRKEENRKFKYRDLIKQGP